MSDIGHHLLAQAQRHLEELDDRIARQQLIVARLNETDDKRHADLARDLLANLEITRGLALADRNRHRLKLGLAADLHPDP